MYIDACITTTLMSPGEADALAVQLTAEDEMGWTYRATHNSQRTNMSYVKVYDETGELVGTL